jgi:hypothetical protein
MRAPGTVGLKACDFAEDGGALWEHEGVVDVDRIDEMSLNLLSGAHGIVAIERDGER